MRCEVHQKDITGVLACIRAETLGSVVVLVGDEGLATTEVVTDLGLADLVTVVPGVVSVVSLVLLVGDVVANGDILDGALMSAPSHFYVLFKIN